MSAVAAALLATASLTAVVASPAHAAVNCNEPANKPNGEGEGWYVRSGTVKSGPYGACRNVKSMSYGDSFYLHCMWVNSYGNTWWYVRLIGTSTYGWVYDSDVYISGYDDAGDGTWEPKACG